ncbi:MAG: hypothetical protein PHP83_03855 [Clostridia bacterium]|nr:hypothetical protein [Clostridia bacterium]
MSETFQKVAYIGLRNDDGSYLINVPLYIKVSEVTKNGVTKMQEDLIHRVSEIMMERYEKQINEKFRKKKKEKKNDEILQS